jgi:hypothetical protein
MLQAEYIIYREDKEMEEVRVEKVGREVVVKVRYEGRVERKVEKEKWTVSTHMVFMPVIDRINDMREDGKEVMRLVDTVMVRDSLTGKGTLEVEVELGEGGEHLDEDALKKIFEVMIGEFVCERDDKPKEISCSPM